MPLRPTTCLTIPMGYKKQEPWGLTFIARPYQEDTLLKMDLPLNKQQKLENYLKTINSFKIVN
jgi:Asp-tRNA(Asn)/Glu-tRNA(Gln) amidotransferase A subunit family amidase